MPGAYDDEPIVPQTPLVNSNTDAAARDKHQPPKKPTLADKIEAKAEAGFFKTAAVLWLGYELLKPKRRRR